MLHLTTLATCIRIFSHIPGLHFEPGAAAQAVEEIGLNISKTCENALKEAIEALEGRKTRTETNGGYVDARSASLPPRWCGRRDLNPGRQRGRHLPTISNDLPGLVSEFDDYCRVVERLGNNVRRNYRCISKRFLEASKGIVSRDSVKGYLSAYLSKTPRTYNNQLKGLRAFIGRFLQKPDIIQGFRRAHVPDYEPDVPTNEQVRQGFYGLTDDLEKALYLFYAAAGPRKDEALNLRMNRDVDFQMRCVKSRHDTRSKKAGITFYNEECEGYLKRYLESRTDDEDLLFVIGSKRFRRLWDRASEKAGFRITAQVLRVWHSTILGELGVPDRYVDVFQGRAPRSVLAKHYTGKGLERLKRIYDKAGLKVLA